MGEEGEGGLREMFPFWKMKNPFIFYKIEEEYIQFISLRGFIQGNLDKYAFHFIRICYFFKRSKDSHYLIIFSLYFRITFVYIEILLYKFMMIFFFSLSFHNILLARPLQLCVDVDVDMFCSLILRHKTIQMKFFRRRYRCKLLHHLDKGYLHNSVSFSRLAV